MRILGIIIAALCTVALVVGGFIAHASHPSAVAAAAAASASASASATPDPQTQAAQKELSVDPERVPEDYCAGLLAKAHVKMVDVKKGVQTPYFTLGSILPQGTGADKRLWSDGPNVPLSPQTLVAEQTVVCHDPGQAAMFMNGVGADKIGNLTIGELNPWMGAQGTPDAIQKWARGCIGPKVSVPAHLKCAQQMADMAYLLGMFHDNGVSIETTAWNVHLAGPVVGGVPSYALNPTQYKGYFLVLSYTTKTGGFCLRFGVNVGKETRNGGDQRLAGLSCATPGKPSKGHAPPAPTPPHKVSPKKSHPTPTPTTPRATPTSPGPTPSNTPSTTPPTSPPTTTPPSTTPPTSPPTTPPPSTQPPKTCTSVYGPGYSGTYPNCTKDGTTVPNPPTSAPGSNPPPGSGSGSGSGGSTSSPSPDPGSNMCYSETTGLPVDPVNGACPPGSFGS